MQIQLRRILVPTDFGDSAKVALTYAAAMVERFDASIHVLHVVETITGPSTLPWTRGHVEELDRAVAEGAWDDLNSVLAPDDCARLHATLSLEWGTPFVEIIRYARAHDVDLIAMGTHGRGGITQLLLGSVAENVVRSSPCPVLTVRHPEHEFVRP